MSEGKQVAQTPSPVTVKSLQADLATLGVTPGMTLLVHSSLSKLGWVNGGPVAVILALEAALGPQGTLVMPTHTSHLSNPSLWKNPPIPESWWETVRQTMPPFDLDLTPTRKMGAIPETFRKQTNVLRSYHPQVSFAARGPLAAQITDDHSLQQSLGEQSPLGRLYELEAWVLLLGVGHGNNTSLHLAEHRAEFPDKSTVSDGAPMLIDGQPKWVEIEQFSYNDEDFEQLGIDFARETDFQHTGNVGLAEAILFPQKPLVDFAVSWMETHRAK